MTKKDETPEFTNDEKAVIFLFAVLLFMFSFIPPIDFVILGAFIFYAVMQASTTQEEEPEGSQVEIIIDDIPAIQGEIDTVEVPTACPLCGEKIGLNTIKWIDERTGICPFCESVITAT